jgi:hypothetical protein
MSEKTSTLTADNTSQRDKALGYARKRSTAANKPFFTGLSGLGMVRFSPMSQDHHKRAMLSILSVFFLDRYPIISYYLNR